MRFSLSDLWRVRGTVDRRAYALVGVLAFALKHNLDRFVAFEFHRPWGLFNYWAPVSDVARITSLRGGNARFLGTLVAVALPFIWVGVVMTIKRLRSAGLPVSLVLLFFVPFLNLAFFLLLCLWPERNGYKEGVASHQRSFARLMPESAIGSAAMALLITAPIGFAMIVLGVRVLANYGWGVFVALPFAMGFAAALIYGIRRPRRVSECIFVAVLSVALMGLCLLGLAFEGLICLIMAMPIAIPLAAFGGLCGYTVQQSHWYRDGAPALVSVLILFVPGVQWTEHVMPRPSPLFVVRSAIDIHASPERVWKEVVAFSEIPPPKEWMFRAGIAYPIRAEIQGTGVGAERHCVFSTGPFVEPIEVWNEPHRLKFSVTSNPSPMEEWTPYSHIDTPHLHGFLVSEGGQFLLTPLPDGRTRLEGTTWYRHGLWPAEYWRIWSDAIIHRIHMRVLTHIQEEAEAERN